MIDPAPTTLLDPSTARGVLTAVAKELGGRPGYLTVSFPNTNYLVHLRPTTPIATPIGKRIIGLIRGEARRIDVVDTGGKYVEPIIGRPRRVQGRVVSTDAATRTVVVDAGMPIHLKLTDSRQQTADFAQGDLVSCDVLDGATFTPSV